MPPITSVINETTTHVSAETIHALHAELAAIGLPVREASTSATPTFDAETAARVHDFQQLYRLKDTGEVDKLTGDVMTLASLVATQTDRAQLRTALQTAAHASGGSAEYNDRLARVAVMIGDYSLATKLSPHLTDLSGAAVDIGNAIATDGIGPGSPRQPEVPFPENFYSYRADLMSDEDIAALRAVAPSASMPRLARISLNAGDPGSVIAPLPPGVFDPPPVTGSGMTRAERLTASALAFLNAIEAWQFGNTEYARQRFASAIDAHNRCQQAVLDYFSIFPDYDMHFAAATLDGRVDELVWRIASDRQTWSDIWAQLGWRRQLLSLAELGQFDWTPITGGRYAHIAYQLLQGNLSGSDQPPPPTNPIGPAHRKIFLDTRLLVIAAVLVPLARGEANRMRRQYAEAIADFARARQDAVPVPNANPPATVPAPIACEFIEVPFARLLRIETMLDQGEAQYKARTAVDDEPDPARRADELARINQISQDLESRSIPGDPRPGALPLQHLVAAITYADAVATMDDDGEYVARAKAAVNDQLSSIASVLGTGDVTSMAFRALGTAVTVPTVTAAGDSVPGLTSGTHPHEPYLEFVPPDGQTSMREVNPRVYALLLQAEARLLQIWSGFNYLGYRDDYTPPWRFPFLLDRARYFSEHAKNAQRDYLNFLNNAENEEFKERSAAQNVELEKANVQIETARVDQTRKEVAASQESVTLANLNASDAQQRLSNYEEFDGLMSVYDAVGLENSIVSSIVTLNPFGISGAVNDYNKAAAQRDLEKKNLALSVGEAQQAAKVAAAQLDAAKAGLAVAGLQRQAALLRHEYALQNLQFMRNQTLNTEQWYRLAGAIRSVSDTYLRYAIELAFLAQQAYNFEADERLDVIRFDYDLSDVGAMLAADFLLRDLDSLEQDLLVGQTTRQQQVKYVLSMAREFPETLRGLAETGQATFTMRLEQLERRFPGLANLRISSVDLQPVAVMDNSRLSVQLEQLGTGMVRLKAQPGSSPLNTTDLAADADWLTGVNGEWVVKVHTSGPEAAVFSGLSRQEMTALSATVANERGAFEGLPGASAWRIDMSLQENRVVPDSLADVLVTFTLSGYYDATLRTAIDHAPRKALAPTSWFSGHQSFPDAYYQFNRTGRMEWPITEDMLALEGHPGALRNLGVLCVPSRKRPELGRMMCAYPVELFVDAAGQVQILRELPLLALSTNGLALNATLNTPAGASVTFDFGDGTAPADSTALPHTYARPGRYDVLIRIAANGRLTEYRAAIVVSRQQTVLPPCIATPSLAATPAGDQIKIQPSLQTAPGDSLSVSWAIDNLSADPGAGPVTFTLEKNRRYVLRFSAVRPLSARFYGRQRYNVTTPLSMDGLRLATNRTFDVSTGNDTTQTLNALGQALFGGGATPSPIDRWTLELPLDANPCLASVSSLDTLQHDLGELADVLLALEFQVD